jgi:hypothetical protein
MSVTEKAERAYEVWISGEAGLAFAGDTDVQEGFIDGFTAGYEARETEVSNWRNNAPA